jgi:predicted Zn finger-like uncharacterized protein
MRCLDASNIRRYVLGTMEDTEADGITQHLISCKRCRQAVAELRGKTDPKGIKSPAADLIKVQCSSCRARYGIPEERVRGRILKLRCKKCGNIIEVTGEVTGGEVSTSVIERGRKLWFLVIKRQRVGPMTEQEVRERFERGEVKGKTYAWRQGFSKWDRLRNISEFKSIVQSLPATPGPITAEPTRKAEIDPDVTEKARPPRSYGPANPGPKDSAELNFDEPIRDRLANSAVKTAYRDRPDDAIHTDPTRLVPDEETATAAGMSVSDSGVMTAYRPDADQADSAVRTAYRPEEGAATDALLTHIHLKEDPMADLGDGESVASVTGSDPEVWQREFAEEPRRAAVVEQRQPVQEEAPPNPRIEEGDWERHMKGERRENSVLFSLSHLQKLSSQPSVEKKGDTGLFQIRPIVGAPAAALLLPQDPVEEKRTGIGTVLGVAFIGVILGAGVLAGILYLVQPDLVRAIISGQDVVVETRDRGGAPASQPLLASAKGTKQNDRTATQPLAPAPGKPDAGAAADQGAAAADASRSAPDQGSVVASASGDRPAVSKATKTPRRKKKRRRRRRRPRGIEVVDPDADSEVDKLEKDLKVPTTGGATAETPETPPPEMAPPPAEKPPGKKPKGELDDLIDAATDSKAKTPPKQPPKKGAAKPAESELPKALTRTQVSAGMRRANGRVKGCYRMFKEAGTIMVKATINGQTGKIRKSGIVGAFSGTPTGDCVSSAVRLNAFFPRFSGPPLTLKYPYMLR